MQRTRRTPQIEKYLDGEELAAFRNAYAAITGGPLPAPQAGGTYAATQAGQLSHRPPVCAIVNLAAYRAAREARTIRLAGGGVDAW